MKKLLLCSFLICSPLYSFQTIKSMFSSVTPAKKPKVQMVKVNKQLDHRKIYKELFELGKDDTVDALVLMIDYQDGKPRDVCQLIDIVQVIQEKKPVIGFILSEATGAGYLLAATTDYVTAHSKSYLGGIGHARAITRDRDLELKAKNGINAKTSMEYITIGKYKNTYQIHAPDITPEQRKRVEQDLQKLYNQSLTLVSQKRGLKKEDAHIWADGRIFSSESSLKVGLIDQVATFFDLEEIALKLLKKKFPEKEFAQEIELLFPKEEEKDKDKKEDDCKKKK